MIVYDDDGIELIPCNCENGEWYAECCNGADGCSCYGKPVNMGKCNLCNGTGWRRPDADMMANLVEIRGYCFVGSGQSGYWSNKPAMGR